MLTIERSREILLASQNILDRLFFGADPYFAEIAAAAKADFETKEEQMIVLLATYAAKEYEHVLETERVRQQYLDSIMQPAAGEPIH